MAEILQQWHESFFDPERIPYAIAAILLTIIIGMVTGPLGGNAYPFIWQIYDKAFGRFGDKLDKSQRPKADLLFRGFLITMFALFIGFLAGKAMEALTAIPKFGTYYEIICLSLLITSGTIWFSLLKLYFAMEKHDVGQGAYYNIARSARTNLTTTDEFGITRTAINFSAFALDKGLVAPILWFVIAGFPGAMVYSGISALAWRFGKQGHSKGFGNTALALEKLLGVIPSILTGVIITCASLFTPTAKLHKGIASWVGHKSRASYEQGGFPLSALAWCLNVSLGGPSQDLNGYAIKSGWVGPEKATAKNDHKHLRRAIYINVLAHILFIGVLLGMYLWAGILSGSELSFFSMQTKA